jgi:hypothetical protein
MYTDNVYFDGYKAVGCNVVRSGDGCVSHRCSSSEEAEDKAITLNKEYKKYQLTRHYRRVNTNV